MDRQPILVLGGTGFVGRHVCEQLVRAGYRVTVPTRRSRNAASVQTLPGLTVIETDVHDDAALAGLIAVLHGDEARFERMHVQLPQRIAAAMRQAGVQRLVHVSALGADLQGPSMYQRSKARGETVLQGQGLELTVLRPSVIFGAEDRFLNLFADLQQVAPLVPLAGSGTRFQPVWVVDVAAAIVRCLQDRHTIGQTFEACGPETFTLGELVQRSGQWAGVNGGQGRPVIPLPDHGTAARRTADEPRQPRLDGGGQRGQRATAGPAGAGHHAGGALGCGARLPRPQGAAQPARSLALAALTRA